MACSSRPALEYVKDARVQLVGKLQCLSVILENLHQQRVFSEEEVSKIRAEKDDFDKTRTIIDWVTSKGDNACYKFLKIIDVTKTRNLEWPTFQRLSHITGPLNLEDLLFKMFLEPDKGKEEVLQDLRQNSEDVVIIFDGITNSSLSMVMKLVEKDLPDAKIVISCRPEVQSDDLLYDWATLKVEVKGFSEQSIRTYLTEMLSTDTDSLNSVLNNTELLSLCHVPMYALMVVACLSFNSMKTHRQTGTITEMYIHILRRCIHNNCEKTDSNECLDMFIDQNSDSVLALAKDAFDATLNKSIDMTELNYKRRHVTFSFLKTLRFQVGPTEWKTHFAFLHYTIQEFFAAIWLLHKEEKITDVLQECLTEDKKHMKYIVPFLCGLMNEKTTQLIKCLIPAEQIRNTSEWFFKKLVDTFVSNPNLDDTEDLQNSILFLCHCLNESQSPEACRHLLEKLNYCLDLSGEHLDPHHCCAVAYLINQSTERKVNLNCKECITSGQGLKLLVGCLPKIQSLDVDKICPAEVLGKLFCQAAEWEEQTGEKTLKLLSLVCSYSTFPLGIRDGYYQGDFLLDLYSHLKDYETDIGRSVLPALLPVYQSAPALWSIDLSKRKASLLLDVLKLLQRKTPVKLRGWSDEESEVRSFLQCLPHISRLG
ncbi:protein NLRC5 [Aplochiton taeniatus]